MSHPLVFFTDFITLSLRNFATVKHISVPKGGWESSDGELEAAASREAVEEGITLYP